MNLFLFNDINLLFIYDNYFLYIIFLFNINILPVLGILP